MLKQIFFLLFISSTISSQVSETDIIADTTRANQLMEEMILHVDSNEFPAAKEKLLLARKIFIETLGSNHEKVGDTWHWEALQSYYQGDIDHPLVVWEKALEIWDTQLGKNNLKSSKARNNIGGLLFQHGKYLEGVGYMEESVNIRLELNGKDNPDNIDYLHNYAVVCKELSYYDKALETHSKVIDLYKKYKSDDPFIVDSYAEIALVFIKKEDYLQAKENIDIGISLAEEFNDPYALTKIQEIHGFWYVYQNKPIEAIPHFKKSLDIRIELVGENHIEIAALNSSLGQAYSNKGDYEKALAFYNKSVNINKRINQGNHPSIGGMYNNIAEIYQVQGNIQRSIEYLKNALSIFQIYLPENHENIAAIYSNIGNAYVVIENYKDAELFLEKALKIRKDLFGEQSQQFAESYHNLGILMTEKGDKEMATENFKEAIQIFNATGEPLENTKVFSSYYNLGLLFDGVEEFDESLKNMQTAIDLASNANDQHPKLSKFYAGMGLKYLEVKDYENAESNLINSYQLLNRDNPIYLIKNKLQLTKTLSHLSDLFYAKYDDTNVEEHLLKAKIYIEEAIGIIEYQLTEQQNFNNSNLVESSKDIFDKALKINASFKIRDNNQLIGYAEKSKASILLGALQNSKALSFSGIPDSLIQIENNLKIDIAYYDKEIQEKLAAGISENDSMLLSISSERFNVKRSHEKLMKNLELEYEEYYKAKYDLVNIDLAEIQTKLLLPDQSLIEYVVTDSILYTFVVNIDTLIINETPLDFMLNEWVSDYREGLIKYHTSKSIPASMISKLTKQYVDSARKLYDKLIAPVSFHLNKNIILVPDGVLGYLPFEILLTEVPKKMSAFHDYPYLLKDHSISYCYSATLLNEMISRKHKKQPSKSTLSIAPFYDGNLIDLFAKVDTMELVALRSDTLQSLKFSGEEAAKVSRMTDGDELIGQEASLDVFLEQANNYRMLHLSTHGVVNDKIGEYAYLAFSDRDENNKYDKLYIRDIYNLSLNSDMVVLSACNTAFGKLQRGEGIISLARAFAFAGSKSIITTHWSVDDKSTGLLMEAFYDHLIKSNLPKDDALRQAKLDYIKDNKGLKAHPYYWAAFIGIGDMSPIQN